MARPGEKIHGESENRTKVCRSRGLAPVPRSQQGGQKDGMGREQKKTARRECVGWPDARSVSANNGKRVHSDRQGQTNRTCIQTDRRVGHRWSAMCGVTKHEGCLYQQWLHINSDRDRQEGRT